MHTVSARPADSLFIPTLGGTGENLPVHEVSALENLESPHAIAPTHSADILVAVEAQRG